MLPALSAHHRVVVASVADPAVARMRTARDTVAEVYDAAAAERTTSLRRRTAAALVRLGVDVLDEPPDQLPVRLADHYLMLNGRGCSDSRGRLCWSPGHAPERSCAESAGQAATIAGRRRHAPRCPR